MNDRTEQNLVAYTCIHRGAFYGIEDRTGSNCAIEAAPSFLCHHPKNLMERCTLWKYCTTATMPVCNNCDLRESPLHG